MNRMSLQHRGRLVRTLNVLARGEIDGRLVTVEDIAAALADTDRKARALRRELIDLGWLRVLKASRQGGMTTALTDDGWLQIGGRPSLDGKARVRRCLTCGSDFQSEGPGHRICDGCRRSDAYRTGVDTSYRLVL